MSFKVSVIIPVYNCEKYISRSIRSVLAIEEVTELIIVDDGSTDLTFNICREFKKIDLRIKIFFHEGKKNRGVSASRNLGIKNAKNNFIAFLDADDYYLPNRFKKTAECFARDESTEAVYEMIGIHSDTSEVNNYCVIEPVKPEFLFENLQPLGHKVWFHINGLTVKKNVFTKSGFFDETLKTSEDTLHWFKMASICKLVAGQIKDFVALSEKLPTGLSSNKSQVDKDFTLMLLKLFIFCNKFSVSNSRKELVLTKFFYFVFNMSYYKKYWGANKLKLFLKVIFTDPGYVLLRSKSFRRYAGDMIGYNHLLHFFKKYNSKGLDN